MKKYMCINYVIDKIDIYFINETNQLYDDKYLIL
jgi:hypothetical protein